MPRRRCLDCSAIVTSGSRCPKHKADRKKLRNDDTARCAQVVAGHVADHGWVCPGFERPPHPSTDLTADHIVPLSRGGAGGPLGVLCRSCNSRKKDR